MAVKRRRNKGSKGEQIVDSILGYNNMEYDREYTIINKENRKQKMDFRINYEDKIYCLEYMGEQHYTNKHFFNLEAIQYNDKLKKEYCLDNNIIFIEISHLENDIDSIFNLLLWYFKGIKKPEEIKLYVEANKFKGNITIENKRKDIVYIGTYGDILNNFKDINESNINKCLNGETDSTGGYTMVFEDEELESIRLFNCNERKKNKKNKSLNKPREKTAVVALNVYTGEEHYYDSINDCQKDLGITGVHNLIYPKTDKDYNRKSLKGYIFKKQGEEYKHNPEDIKERLVSRKPQQVNKSQVSKRPIYCVDINTGEETYFESIGKAEELLNIKGISSYLYGKRNRVSMKGKMFRLTDGEYRHTLEDARDKIQKKYVKATNIETGEFIIDSVNKLSSRIGTKGTNISKVLNGKGKTSKGYTFEYYTD